MSQSTLVLPVYTANKRALVTTDRTCTALFGSHIEAVRFTFLQRDGVEIPATVTLVEDKAAEKWYLIRRTQEDGGDRFVQVRRSIVTDGIQEVKFAGWAIGDILVPERKPVAQ